MDWKYIILARYQCVAVRSQLTPTIVSEHARHSGVTVYILLTVTLDSVQVTEEDRLMSTIKTICARYPGVTVHILLAVIVIVIVIVSI